AGLRVDRADNAVLFALLAIVEIPRDHGRRYVARATSAKGLALHVLGILLDKKRRVVFPGRDIEEASGRAERRVIPVGSALVAGINQSAFTVGLRLRNLHGAATLVKAI